MSKGAAAGLGALIPAMHSRQSIPQSMVDIRKHARDPTLMSPRGNTSPAAQFDGLRSGFCSVGTQVASYMRAVLRTLAQCHTHCILHRDVKPGAASPLHCCNQVHVLAVQLSLHSALRV